MKIRPLLLSCCISSGLLAAACGGDADDDLFGPGGTAAGSAGAGAKGGGSGATSSGSGGSATVAGSGGTSGKGGSSGKGGASAGGKGGVSAGGEGGTSAGGEGGTSAGGEGGASAGGEGGASAGGEGGASAGGSAGAAGGEGGASAGGSAGAAGAGGASPVVIEIIGKRNDQDSTEFWVMQDDLVWIGQPNAGGNRTPFRAPRAGGNGGRMSNLILGTQEALVPDTLNPAVFYDGQVAGQSGIGKFTFGAGVGLAASTPDPVFALGSSTGHLCWAEAADANLDRVVCRTRASAARIVSGELWSNISSLAGTTKWVYFSQSGSLMRWDRGATKAAKVADNIQRVKAVGDVVWGIGAGGHIVRVADGGSTVDYGTPVEASNAILLTTGVTDKYLYLGISLANLDQPRRIVRVNEKEGQVETVLPDACSTPITSVGARDKYVYFLCEDDNIYRAALP